MSCGLSHTHANALGRFSSCDTIERHLTRLYEYLKGVRGTMVAAEIRQVSDTTFIARGDTNHWVVMDDQRQFGGCEAGSDPMEMLLFSLGGCMGMWLDVLLRKSRVSVGRILLHIEGVRVGRPGAGGCLFALRRQVDVRKLKSITRKFLLQDPR